MPALPNEYPEILSEFLNFESAIRRLSPLTVAEYGRDLQTFFRYLKRARKLTPDETPFNEIPITDVDANLLRTVTLGQLYDYLSFAARERPKFHRSPDSPLGDDDKALARKVASLRTFFKFLTVKRNYLDYNPAAELESPKIKKSLPRYLTIDEAHALLDAVDGQFRARDYCILVLFLNCGLRVSELAALNRSSIQEDTLRVRGKGNKERLLYLNDACIDAIEQYLPERLIPDSLKDKDALFVSRQRNRISVQNIKKLVEKHLMVAGLSGRGYSAHKLRHTAATLMYQNGVDIRTVQEFLGHENLSTTQIYTHLASDSIREAARANPLSDYVPRTDDTKEPDEDDDA
ncbi:MAG: tyrosine recombinase XerC [Clostridiales bacterium]|jgi:site-specific recombinase XerD|nr:tyrosine recombinase XerC [Clostridiales bacterium]